MDLQAALGYLAKLAVDAEKTEIIRAPGNSGPWAVVHRDGKVEWFERECGPRQHTAYSFDSFIRATIGLHTDDSETWVFVPRGQDIIAVSQADVKDKPRDTVEMPVCITDEFKFLDAAPSSFDQKGLLRVLRVDLHRCAVAELIDLLTHVTFTNTDEGDSKITTGKTSLSRKTLSELESHGQGEERKELPETVTLNCHYLEQTTRTMLGAPTVKCLLAVDPGEKKPFSLVPLGGETAKVIDETQDWIVDHLTKAFADTEGIQVFAGEA